MKNLTREQFIALCLFKGAKMIQEQDEMGMSMGQPPPQQGAPMAQDPSQQQQQAPQQGDPTQTANGADGQPLTADTIIDRINAIRGGKTFDDPEVYGEFTTLFKNLSNQDKATIDRFLMDVGKILINATEDGGNGQGSTPPPNQQNNGQQPQQGGGAPQQQMQQQAGPGMAMPGNAGAMAPPIGAV